ncbi:MAG: DUF1080 domain-containing protein [Gemmataceae bacterium]
MTHFTRIVALCLIMTSAFTLTARQPAESFLKEDLEGWEGLVKEYWTFKDGALVGNSPKGLTFNTFLASKKKYRDFELSFQVRLKGGAGNSGVQIRSKLLDTNKFAVGGPQCDIGAGYWGSLYGEQFGGMMKQAPGATQKAVKASEFNKYHIRCVGKKVTIRINGVTTVDEEFSKMPEDGIIAFQLHAGGPMEVTYKDIVFTEIK